MVKFQLDFSKVPRDLRNEIGRKVQGVLKKLTEDRYNNCTDANKNFIIIGYETIVNWSNVRFKPEEYPTYDVISDWDKWTNLVTPAWKAKSVRITSDYDAEVHSDYIKVGCQKISFDNFEKLAKLVQEAKDFAKK